jgi:hypothetical protein
MNPYVSIEHAKKSIFTSTGLIAYTPSAARVGGVKPVAYDWADLTAEVYKVYAPMGYGGLIENVMISVRKTGTEEVIDRLFLCDDIEQGKQYWALARLYMQSGYDALPDSIRPLQGQKVGNGLNPMQYLAPKVRWPAKIDVESRSAPTAGSFLNR